MAESLERCFNRALLKNFPSEDGDTDEEFQIHKDEKERKDKKRSRGNKNAGPESLIKATEQVQRKRPFGITPSEDSRPPRPPWITAPPNLLPPNQHVNQGNIRGMYHPSQQLHHPHGPHMYGQRMAMNSPYPNHIPRHGDPNMNRLPHGFNMQHRMVEGHHMGARYPMGPNPNYGQPGHLQHHPYMGPTHGPSLGPRPVAHQPGPPSEASMYPSHHQHPMPNRFPGPEGPAQDNYPGMRPPGMGPPHLWNGMTHRGQEAPGGMHMQDPNVMNQHNFSYGGMPPPVGHKPWPEAAGYPQPPPNAQYQISATGSVPGHMSSRPVLHSESSGRAQLASMLESPEMLALQQLSSSSGPPTAPHQHMGHYEQSGPPSAVGSSPALPSQRPPPGPELQLPHPAPDNGPDSLPSQQTHSPPKGSISERKVLPNSNLDGAFPHKHIIMEDHKQLPITNGHQSHTDKMHSPANRVHDNETQPGLSQGSNERHNQEVGDQGQGHTSSHLKCKDGSKDPPPQSQHLLSNSPQVSSPPLLSPHHAHQTPDNDIDTAHNQQTHQHLFAKQPPQAGVGMSPQKTQQHLNPQPHAFPNLSPQRPMPQNMPMSATAAPSQPAAFTGLPLQPSPGDKGAQRPGEHKAKPDPSQQNVNSSPINGVQKHQAFSPNGQQPTGLNSAPRGFITDQAMPSHPQSHMNGAMGPYSMVNPQYNPAHRPGTHQHALHQQPFNTHSSSSLSYHQQGTTYSYNTAPEQQHPHANMYAGPQYHYPHAQSQGHHQASGKGGYTPEDWHRMQYQPPQPMSTNAYLPAAHARGSSRAKDSSVSPMGSEGSSAASLMSPGPVNEGTEDEPRANSSRASPTKQIQLEKSEQPESPKEILDLDSHNAAAHRGPQLPQQHPAAAAQMAPGFMYNPRSMRSAPPHHMSQICGMGNGAPYPSQPYPNPQPYAAQRPHPHLMEALQRPQQLPYSPGQSRMSIHRPSPPGGYYQSMMVQQRGLPPQHFIHPSQQMTMPGGPSGRGHAVRDYGEILQH